MIGSWSRYLADALLEHLIGNTPFSVPASFYVGLWCNSLDEDSDGSTPGEVMAASYTRMEVVNEVASFGEILDGEKRNANEILFPVPTEDWGIVTHFAILDADVDGSILFYGELATPKEVEMGKTISFPPAALRIRFA